MLLSRDTTATQALTDSYEKVLIFEQKFNHTYQIKTVWKNNQSQ